MSELHGIIPPMVTPLLEDDLIDEKGTVRLIDHMLAGGVHGLFILGTTGEAQSLSARCRYDFVRLVCAAVAGRVPVLAGITDTSMDESLRLAEHARMCGAAAVVSAPPYYFSPSQTELVEYYTALADKLALPLYLYNMPSHVKVNLEPETVRRLAVHPRIRGIKDSSANMSYFQTVMYLTRSIGDFAMYVGPEELTAECILAGAAGAVNGGANLFPELYVEMYEAARRGDVRRVGMLQEAVMKICTSLYNVGRYGSSYLKGVKCALSLMGICSDHLSYPYRKFRNPERARIRAALENLGAGVQNP